MKSTKKKPLDSELSSKNIAKLIKGNNWVRFEEVFELKPKNKTITLRISESMLDAIKVIADNEETDYQKLIRKALADLIKNKLKKVA